VQSRELGETPAQYDHRLDHSACCTAAHPVALCALQGLLQGSGPLPSWREPTSLARCARRGNWTVQMRCAADSALSKQQSRQSSATAARAEYRISPQPRRKGCNSLRLYGFCGDETSYAEMALRRFRRLGIAREAIRRSCAHCSHSLAGGRRCGWSGGCVVFLPAASRCQGSCIKK